MNKIFLVASDVVGSITAPSGFVQPVDTDKTVSRILDTLTTIVIIASVGYMIFSALNMVTSGGDAQKIKQAQAGLMYSIIAVIIALLAYALLYFILNTLGVTAPGNLLPQT